MLGFAWYAENHVFPDGRVGTRGSRRIWRRLANTSRARARRGYELA